MSIEVSGLVCRDHEDLDRGLVAMVDPVTSPCELTNLLDIVRLALAVHSAAEAKIYELLGTRFTAPRTIARLADQARLEHGAQRAAADALATIRPATLLWYEAALELRAAILDHAGRAEVARWTLHDQLPAHIRRSLASEYATERMRVLASTSPYRIAAHRETTGPLLWRANDN